ncbi:MAG: LVIVD repeat-containing protein, partial [Actinomycetota bacterium]
MRRSAVTVAILMASLLPTFHARGQTGPPPEETFISENLTLLTTVGSPGVIGARFQGDVMYVTSVLGLTTYDVSDPANPTQLGFLPLPHFENEDVDLGGDILLISNDAAESTGILYVIDISDPAAPALLSTLQMGGNPLLGGPGHTASCIKDCRWAWVTNVGNIDVIDLGDPAAPAKVGTFETPAGGGVAAHDVQVDRYGYVWVAGFGGTVAYQLPRDYDGTSLGIQVAMTSEDGFSTYFEEFGIGSGGNPNDYIHHNSARNKRVVLITEEDYTRPACKGAGSFQTWNLAVGKGGVPDGTDLTPLDQWETEVLTANPSSTTALVCSAHYFDVRGNVVAQGWYEQGLRILDVSKPTTIRQIGYFVLPNALTWA